MSREGSGTAMSIVTIAHCEGSYWLIGGQTHIDVLLADDLPPDVPVEFVECESRADLHTLWDQLDGSDGSDPWQINPKIRSDDQSVGKGGVSTCRSRWSPD